MYILWFYLIFALIWPGALVFLMDDKPGDWEMAAMQFTMFVILLGCCAEMASKSKGLLLVVLVFSVLSGILTHAVYYTQLGLVLSSDGKVFYPAWRDALYFSVVTFTTLGYGDMAPREEYRLVAGFQAIYGYLFLGALVGVLVALFNRR